MSTLDTTPAGADLRRRITAEFGEMPGLSLTMPQAARLLDVDLAECARVLEGLVEDGYLQHVGGRYLLAACGRAGA
jgi:hypothetical protein